MTREQMMDNVMKKFGLEVDVTIQFCRLAESRFPEKLLKVVYNCLMN